MKALSVKQPWASYIARGNKTIETRTWSTNYRGDLLIVSSKRPVLHGFLSGMALCIVNIVGCRPMISCDAVAACCKIYPHAQAWILTNIQPIKPFPVKGKLSLYDVPFKVEDLIFQRKPS